MARWSKELSQRAAELEGSPEKFARFHTLKESRGRLPAAAFKAEVLAALQDQVVLIRGETGCGKTTQVPQFLLEEAIARRAGGEVSIVCTQPRRLAAIGVASRVAEEMGEPDCGGTVGYQVRLESKASSRTRLVFVTTGVLLRRLQDDPNLAAFTHIVVDEVHERNVDTDFLLSILREVLPRRRDLKLVLMSATMDADVFSDYFAPRAAGGRCTTLHIPGFVHPVEEFYLEDVLHETGYVPPHSFARSKSAAEGSSQTGGSPFEVLDKSPRVDYDLIGDVVRHINSSNAADRGRGAILVFVSGVAEIARACNAIERACGGGGTRSKSVNEGGLDVPSVSVLQLHGSLSGRDQAKVFSRARIGSRKVVVSTNVAETSITIDDCEYVVDSGKLKETQYDAMNRMSRLVEVWVSRASATQRRGRAGRVRPGQCYRLYSRSRFQKHFAAQQAPEIHRVPLEQLAIQVLAMELGQPSAFLGTLVQPPPREAVLAAEQLLLDVGAAEKAVTAQGKPPADALHLTPLGRHLARLPMDLRLGKMLLYGSLLRCAEEVLTITAGMSTRSPFLSPVDARNEADAAHKPFRERCAQSDHIMLLVAFEQWLNAGGEGQRRVFAEQHFLSHQRMTEIRDLRADLARSLEDVGFSSRSSVGLSAEGVQTIKAVICAGLYPNVLYARKPREKFVGTAGGALATGPEAREIRYYTVERNSLDHRSNVPRLFLHPSSVNSSDGDYTFPYLVYREKVETSRVFVRDSTVVPPYSLLLFGGNLVVNHEKGELVVDGCIVFKAPARVGVLVRELQELLRELLLEKIALPTLDISASPVMEAILRLVRRGGFME